MNLPDNWLPFRNEWYAANPVTFDKISFDVETNRLEVWNAGKMVMVVQPFVLTDEQAVDRRARHSSHRNVAWYVRAWRCVVPRTPR